MQIAIDGPAGAGKSTIAKKIAAAYNMTYLDTGAMYRCIAHCVLNQIGDRFDNEDDIIKIAQSTVIRFEGNQVFCNEKDVTQEIRTPLVSRHTSDVARIKAVRDLMVAQQREYAKDHEVVMDGRDIGSVVLPDAQVKFFLDADVLERAKRRKIELDEKGNGKALAEIKNDIEKRDTNDRNRSEGPLVKVADAIVVDTTGKSIEEVYQEMKTYIDEVCR
ncbi:(d)CMP kinase [Acetobacterium wieringae]|jgi:cytidylate kinase|uniref:Cytidylate kinase n=2 Tax=Acetobacterium wieringae TaxID=52694 RepID=A0A1F2PIP9_9FIRM|nr:MULTISPECIES: (d)CMP kinase [Acetobacterium]OFV70742.1 cytidylate kinase [Acetobacterium wieringae]OXS27292.1 MAG: cytidylate kinase [Acetobacterium sp. MES1]TYC87830.1 (d)CMP kinase [Acetobacterium wieringae]UYO62081.1 (d)CMP kinase [Acetobacterium wieringae]VUZ25922.1 Cytidylate kinase [Acetobacterium wieringae]